MFRSGSTSENYSTVGFPRRLEKLMIDVNRGGSAVKMQSGRNPFDLTQIRQDFPIFAQKPHGR